MSVEPMRWFDRRFTFDQPAGVFPAVLERLHGTPARLEELVAGAEHDVLVRRSGDAWSVHGEIGHLGDLEELWSQRVSDFLNRKAELTPADLTNRKTHEAGHDERDLGGLLQRFREARNGMVQTLDALDEEQVVLTSRHPRLGTPMRMLDLAIFVAEHDDHHLARIRALLRG